MGCLLPFSLRICNYYHKSGKIDTEPNTLILTQDVHYGKVKRAICREDTLMKPIEIEKVQEMLENFIDKQVYIHLETTNGAYASHNNEKAYNVGAYIRNAVVSFNQAKIIEDGNMYRIGLKLEKGWVYAEGLTDWTIHKEDKLLLAGHDHEGRLMVSLQISETPFDF